MPLKSGNIDFFDLDVGLVGIKAAEIEDVAALNKDLVDSLVPSLISLDAKDLQDVTSHLDEYGRCFLLLSLTLASQQGETLLNYCSQSNLYEACGHFSQRLSSANIWLQFPRSLAETMVAKKV